MSSASVRRLRPIYGQSLENFVGIVSFSSMPRITGLQWFRRAMTRSHSLTMLHYWPPFLVDAVENGRFSTAIQLADQLLKKDKAAHTANVSYAEGCTAPHQNPPLHPVTDRSSRSNRPP